MQSVQYPHRALRAWVCIGLFVFVRSTAATADEVDVYLLGGQSNMQGIGKLANIPEDIPRQIPNVFFDTGKTFEPLQIGETKTSLRTPEFGPEIGFALEIANPERPTFLIKHSVSGMPLHKGWDGNKWAGGTPTTPRRNFYPGQNASDKGRGTLYHSMLRKYQNGISRLVAEGHQPVIRGFVWMQGEQDAKHKESATTYAASLKQLSHRLQEDIKAPEGFSVVFGQVLPFEPAMDRFTYREQLRAQMEAADSASNSSDRIPNAKMISTDGFGLMPDTVHYDASGQLKLGKEFAKAMKQLHSTSE